MGPAEDNSLLPADEGAGPPAGEDLAGALRRHGIALAPGQVARLERFCVLLWEWNAKVNLTRHTDFEKFVARDVVDSLALAEPLQPREKVLDVGTGGGVPGVVLAVLRPQVRVWLCESVGKKARAAADIVQRMGLAIPVDHGRAEELLARQEFNTLVVRAVAPLRKLLEWFRPRWDAFDRMLVLKGPAWVEERGEARHRGLLRGLALRKLKSYPVPGTGAESVLLQICPADRMADDKQCRLRDIG